MLRSLYIKAIYTCLLCCTPLFASGQDKLVSDSDSIYVPPTLRTPFSSNSLTPSTPSSPQAEAFQRMGEFTLNNAYGTPDISIPLYEIDHFGYKIPLTLRYIATPLRPGYNYDAVTGNWPTMDPLCEKYYSLSPYSYCGNNPIKYIDPNGMSYSPIYNQNGCFLGTDDEGLTGNPIVMNDIYFSQGMSHSDAVSKSMEISEMSDEAFENMMDHYSNLPNRPDYDGFVSVDEGVAWAKNHPYALKNPTPDNTLYIDSSQLDFGNLSSSEFERSNVLIPINLFNWGNVMNSISNDKLRATVYALGRFDAILTNKYLKTIIVVNNSATDYDWNEGGSWIRDKFIKANNLYYDIDPNIHGFKTFYYGIGHLNK